LNNELSDSKVHSDGIEPSDDSSGSSQSVAVIGAGWAGLAAALYLAERGTRVALFEAAPQAGGRARRLDLSLDQQDFVLDNGQHLLVGAYRDTLRIISSLGCERLLQRLPMQLNSSAGLRLRTAQLPAPLHLLVGLISSRGLSWSARLRMLGFMLGLRLKSWRTSVATVASLLEESAQGRELVEVIWRPLCIATMNTDIDAACAQTFANVLRDTLGGSRRDSDFVISLVSLGDLFAIPAVARLEQLNSTVHFRSPIRELVSVPRGWRLRGSADDPQFEQVIIAVPPANSLAVLGESAAPDTLRTALAAFEYEPIATTYLWWDEQLLISDGRVLPAWIQLQESFDQQCFGQWLFDRGVQNGQRLAGVVVSTAARALLVDSGAHSDGQRIGTAIAEQVSKQMGLPLAHTHRTVIEKRATFRCTPDRPKLQFDALSQTMPGVWLAGDHVWPDYPATLEAAVRSGEAAARACQAALGGRD
jgi:hydroxysqualene dehydroxylase